MKLPNFSNMMRLGQLRHIQSVCETGDFKNPDYLADFFLSPSQRFICHWMATLRLARLRADPFYGYLVARTRYYDGLFVGAISNRVNVIVNIGCGSDTRSYRFGRLLQQNGIRVLECDQPEAITNKQCVARKKCPADHVSYLSINLNRERWDELADWFGAHESGSVFVLMEGVSPYIGSRSFARFLDFLSASLPAGSRFAYDFKFRGVADRFGESPESGELFRQPDDEKGVSLFHRAHGFRLDRMDSSAALTLRMLPRMREHRSLVFAEDGLLQLTVETAKSWMPPCES